MDIYDIQRLLKYTACLIVIGLGIGLGIQCGRYVLIGKYYRLKLIQAITENIKKDSTSFVIETDSNDSHIRYSKDTAIQPILFKID